MQQTLLGSQKKEEERAVSKPKRNEAPSNVFVEELKDVEKNETFAAAYVRRITSSTLNEKRTFIDVNFEYSIKPYPQERSHYGGYWGSGNTYSEETLQNLFENLLNFKKGLLEIPYTEDLKDAYRYTNLKEDNVLVVITVETKKYIETATKTKWEDFQEKFNAIKNKKIPDSYISLVQREYELEKAIEAKDKRISALKEEYLKKLEDKNTLISREPSEIYNELKKAKSELEALEKELKEIRNQIDNSAAQ